MPITRISSARAFRARDAARPARLALIQRRGRVGLRDVEQRAQDVLGHLHPVRTARAGERDARPQVVAREPMLDAGRHGLDPAQPRHPREQPGGRAPRHQRLGLGEQILARRLGALQLDDAQALRHARSLQRRPVGRVLVVPEQQQRRRHAARARPQTRAQNSG
ncbi:MAG: hypothetical protein MUC64_03420 [Rubritepida sp.]|nr:hypothetical protein [Rubritepida sp.]